MGDSGITTYLPVGAMAAGSHEQSHPWHREDCQHVPRMAPTPLLTLVLIETN
jgi:hypothetical protein